MILIMAYTCVFLVGINISKRISPSVLFWQAIDDKQ